MFENPWCRVTGSLSLVIGVGPFPVIFQSRCLGCNQLRLAASVGGKEPKVNVLLISDLPNIYIISRQEIHILCSHTTKRWKIFLLQETLQDLHVILYAPLASKPSNIRTKCVNIFCRRFFCKVTFMITLSPLK